jgi:hypothetical protein
MYMCMYEYVCMYVYVCISPRNDSRSRKLFEDYGDIIEIDRSVFKYEYICMYMYMYRLEIRLEVEKYLRITVIS